MEYDFETDIVDLDTLQTEQLVRRQDLPAAEALILDGYLATSPEKLMIAVSLSTLETFHTLCLVKPSLSVEGFTKFVCYKYCVSPCMPCMQLHILTSILRSPIDADSDVRLPIHLMCT